MTAAKPFESQALRGIKNDAETDTVQNITLQCLKHVLLDGVGVLSEDRPAGDPPLRRIPPLSQVSLLALEFKAVIGYVILEE